MANALFSLICQNPDCAIKFKIMTGQHKRKYCCSACRISVFKNLSREDKKEKVRKSKREQFAIWNMGIILWDQGEQGII